MVAEKGGVPVKPRKKQVSTNIHPAEGSCDFCMSFFSSRIMFVKHHNGWLKKSTFIQRHGRLPGRNY